MTKTEGARPHTAMTRISNSMSGGQRNLNLSHHSQEVLLAQLIYVRKRGHTSLIH